MQILRNITLCACLSLATAFTLSAKGNQPVSEVDTSLNSSEKYVLRVDGKPFYMTNVQLRLDKLKGYEGWDDTALEAVVRQAAEDGFNTVSLPLFWREVEPKKDKFDWTILDQYLDWCHKYGLKAELLWFSWSSGGRIQWLTRNRQTPESDWTLRDPDYVCSKNGTSEYKIIRTEDPWTLDWHDPALRERDRYVLGKVMEHVAEWDKAHGNPHTVIGVQIGNEVHGHEYDLSADDAVDYCSYVAEAVKQSHYKVWTRMNCVSWMTRSRIEANEKKRANGGTNIDFVGIDIYGTDADKVFGDMDGQMPPMGTNYSMIMEIDAKDPRTPFYQMAALAGDKAFDYYNYAVVDGNSLYEQGEGMTLKERPQINYVRQRNKILNLANQDIAIKSHSKSLYVYNRRGEEKVAGETGLKGIAYTSEDAYSQAIAILHSPKEIVLLSTGKGSFMLPDAMKVKKATYGFFDGKNHWLQSGDIKVSGNKVEMPESSAIMITIN